MATHEDLLRREIVNRMDNGNKLTVEAGVRYGNHFDEKIFPYQTKIETDQKCVKPTISIYGSDSTGMAAKLGEIYDEIVKEFQEKRHVPVAPLTSTE